MQRDPLAGCSCGRLEIQLQRVQEENIPRVVDYLLKFYPLEHELTIYEAAQYPICEPIIEKVRLVGASMNGREKNGSSPTHKAFVVLAARQGTNVVLRSVAKSELPWDPAGQFSDAGVGYVDQGRER